MNITVLGLTNPDVSLKRMHQLYNVVGTQKNRLNETALLGECRTKHLGTKHPMPFFDTPNKTPRIDLPPRTKHPMQFLSPWTKHPMPFLSPRTKHPMPLLPPRTKHPTLCLKPMKVHKTSHLVNCHYYKYS